MTKIQLHMCPQSAAGQAEVSCDIKPNIIRSNPDNNLEKCIIKAVRDLSNTAPGVELEPNLFLI